MVHEDAFIGETITGKYLSEIHPDWVAMILNVHMLRQVDLLVLRVPRYDCINQTQLKPQRVWLMATCAVHYNINCRLVARYLNGKYFVKWRDIESIVGVI